MKIRAAIVSLFLLVLPLFVSVGQVTAQILEGPCAEVSADICDDNNDPGTNASGLLGTDSAVGAAVLIVSMVAGVVSIIMVIIGGLKFVTAGGDASKAASGRTTLIYALVGLVVAVMAQGIIIFVIDKV